jgi:hypothetical protein
MDGTPWSTILTAAVSGGITVKLLDIVYAELAKRRDRKSTVSSFIDDQLTPILKSADELSGKLRACAERDFTSLPPTKPTEFLEKIDSTEIAGLAYLFCNFWAHIELFRARSLSINVSRDKRGKTLLRFISTAEARRVRIKDRITQRAIGESMIATQNGSVLSFIDFYNRYNNDPQFRHWIYPLIKDICDTRDKITRQKILRFGVVLHAMIDTLDPQHHITKDRPGYSNKLSKKSKTELMHRVFAIHLKCVRNPKKYV